MKNAEWFRNRAKELYHEEGEIEVDNDARVSTGDDDGAYVAAWVWVPLTKQKPTHKFGTDSTRGRRKEGRGIARPVRRELHK
ncbi:MAG TPA: hypothetical protein VN943_05085 [Candidatus Acidoferrum sp.]|nr:hypothetical protein [Candidatus Acidoferrum sp.]